ncbi:MAG TPA: phenylalanine--tRNA ligase subunit alpha [Gammaproteobacteria bacterium]|nr:phenylalanine--tRNA ligase subunit alpha [Gammaproteobacteria bacterium]
MQALTEIVQRALEDIIDAADLAALDSIRVQYMGKKGELTSLLKNLGELSAEERPKAGQQLNVAKEKISVAIDERRAQLESQFVATKLASQAVDVTLPARGMTYGSLHPVTKTRLRIEECFRGLGFTIAEGPEIEDDYHNFVALNIPEHHPARAMQDTFYFGNGDLLRTHTSPVQIREMQKGKPPFRLIATGRVYRCDYDITHTPMFHQVEGLMVDENITLANLKSILTEFLQTLFEQPVKIRLRSSYFPFTEPSAEVDMQCTKCGGAGCRICKHTGWLEILGCGMVHPKVLENCNIDSERYTGWAFGMGIDRVAMLRYNIPDLRMMFENDLRFLQQF